MFRSAAVIASFCAFSLSLSLPAEAKPAPSSSAKRRSSVSAKAAAASANSASTSSKEIKISSSASTITQEIKLADSKPIKESTASASLSGEKALVVPINGMLRERGSSVVLFGETTKSLKDYLDLFRKVREDGKVKTVVIRFGSTEMGMATAQELRQAIDEMRGKGKKTIALLESDSQSLYTVAAACDEVVLPPSGDIGLHGVKADLYYLKNLLDKVGVQAEVVHMGQYKSYGETFTNDAPTTPARENMTEIVDDTFNLLVESIAKSRKKTTEEVERLVNQGPVGAEEAKAAGLIDTIAYADSVLAKLKKSGAEIVLAEDYDTASSDSSAGDLNLFSLISMMSKQQSTSKSSTESKHPGVAVLYAVGPIEMGSDDSVGFSSEEVVASDDFIETLEDIRTDKKIKAVILRVNSPGGSAFASDLIWQKIQELKKEKPVIATMGDVAASGGYYIAMGAHKVIAQEGTMTGSIGVVGGKPNLSGAYKMLGINKETISRGEYTGLYSETSSFSPKERQSIEKMMARTYNEFISKAAQGRHMTKERLDEVAQGRVWSGSRAKKVGLVDELGGMSTAVAEVKKSLGMKLDEKVALISYPKEIGLMDLLQKAIGGSSTNAHLSLGPALAPAGQLGAVLELWSSLPSGLRRALSNAASIGRMLHHEHVLAVMPTFAEIR